MDKVWLVTGSASGLGRNIAEAVLESGDRLPRGSNVSGRDIGAFVRQRLLNKSRAQGRPFQELRQYFAMERFLYRLGKSPYSDRRAFVRRSRFSEEAGELVRLVTEIRQFALPMLSAIAAGNPFKALWKPGGPWE